ncbi:sialidase family protein [Actinomycetes bacterium KLBMP 9797]
MRGAIAILVGAALGVVTIKPATAELAYDVLFQRDTFGAACYRIPALVRTRTGALLAFAEKRIAGASWCNDTGHIDIVMRRSDDNGRTWNPPVTQPPTVVLEGTDSNPAAAVTRGNPAPVVDMESGRILLLSTLNPGDSNRPRTPYLQISTDDGRTFGHARSLADAIDQPDWGWYATGPGHGIQLQRGVHAGRIVVGTNFTDAQERNGAQLVYTDDAGDTWQVGARDIRTTSEIVPQELSLFERTDGAIYAAARDNGESADGLNRAYALSRDGGETFAAPFATVPGLVADAVQASTLRLRATDQGDKYNRVLFAAPSHPTNRRDMVIRSTFDEGATWQAVAEGTDVTDDLYSGYSDMALLVTGEIGLLYEGGASESREQIRFARFTESAIGPPDGAAGPRSPDLSGLDNDAILRGGPTLVPGRFDEALRLDGVDDHVQFPFAESLAAGSGDFTAMTWIRYGASTADQAIIWGYGMLDAPQFWLRAEPGSNRIRAALQTASGTAFVSSAQSYADGAWHHVALRWSGGTLSLWVDGAAVASAAAPAGTVSPARPFRMYAGQRPDGANRLTGALDETRFYRRGLTAGELQNLWLDNRTDIAGAVLRLPFTAPGPATPDTSGVGNHGFVRGGAGVTAGRFGNALGLDGTDDWAHVGYTHALNLGGGDFTAAAWIRYSLASRSQAILWAYGMGDVSQLWLRAEPRSSRLRALVQTPNGAVSVNSAQSYADGAWHHVVLRRAGGTVTLWVDGSQVAAAAAPAGSVTAGHGGGIEGFAVGQRPDGANRFQGAIDEVRVWPRALSTDELAQVRASNTAVTGAVLRLPLDAVS